MLIFYSKYLFLYKTNNSHLKSKLNNTKNPIDITPMGLYNYYISAPQPPKGEFWRLFFYYYNLFTL